MVDLDARILSARHKAACAARGRMCALVYVCGTEPTLSGGPNSTKKFGRNEHCWAAKNRALTGAWAAGLRASPTVAQVPTDAGPKW
jgi:hypothetical protein